MLAGPRPATKLTTSVASLLVASLGFTAINPQALRRACQLHCCSPQPQMLSPRSLLRGLPLHPLGFCHVLFHGFPWGGTRGTTLKFRIFEYTSFQRLFRYPLHANPSNANTIKIQGRVWEGPATKPVVMSIAAGDGRVAGKPFTTRPGSQDSRPSHPCQAKLRGMTDDWTKLTNQPSPQRDRSGKAKHNQDLAVHLEWPIVILSSTKGQSWHAIPVTSHKEVIGGCVPATGT